MRKESQEERERRGLYSADLAIVLPLSWPGQCLRHSPQSQVSGLRAFLTVEHISGVIVNACAVSSFLRTSTHGGDSCNSRMGAKNCSKANRRRLSRLIRKNSKVCCCLKGH